MTTWKVDLRVGDIVVALLFLALAVFCAWSTTTWLPPVMPGDPGAAFFPRFALGVIAVFSASLFLRRLMSRSAPEGDAASQTVSVDMVAVAVAADAGLAVRGADDGGDFHAAFLKLLGHLDRDDVAAAAGDDEGAVTGHEIEVAQDAVRQAADVFEEHGLPLAVRADDGVVGGEGEFDDRVEAGEGAVARPHFLDHHATMARPEEMYHTTGQDRSGEKLCNFLYVRFLFCYRGNNFLSF